MKILYDLDAIMGFYDSAPKFGDKDSLEEYIANNFEQVFDQDLRFVGYETKVYCYIPAARSLI